MIRMAKETPSGYPPHSLMTAVSRPHPAPKMSIPLAVTGDDYEITFFITQVVDDHGDTVDATAWRLTKS